MEILKNGKIIPILSKDDALEVIRENLSSDLASYLSYIIEDMELEEERVEKIRQEAGFESRAVGAAAQGAFKARI